MLSRGPHFVNVLLVGLNITFKPPLVGDVWNIYHAVLLGTWNSSGEWSERFGAMVIHIPGHGEPKFGYAFAQKLIIYYRKAPLASIASMAGHNLIRSL